MGRWTEMARELETVRRDKTAISDKTPPKRQAFGSFDGFGTVPELPQRVMAGLDRLRDMRAPSSAAGWSGVWKCVVDDALWLAGSGMAQSALALGWEPLHIFGVSPDYMSDARPGLAGWLNGSRSVVLLDDGAISREGDLRRVLNVRPPAGAVYLWDLGK